MTRRVKVKDDGFMNEYVVSTDVTRTAAHCACVTVWGYNGKNSPRSITKELHVQMSHMMHHSIRHAARIRFIQISIVINNYLPLRNGVEKRHSRINMSTSTLPAIIAETTEHIAI